MKRWQSAGTDDKVQMLNQHVMWKQFGNRYPPPRLELDVNYDKFLESGPSAGAALKRSYITAAWGDVSPQTRSSAASQARPQWFNIILSMLLF